MADSDKLSAESIWLSQGLKTQTNEKHMIKDTCLQQRQMSHTKWYDSYKPTWPSQGPMTQTKCKVHS